MLYVKPTTFTSTPNKPTSPYTPKNITQRMKKINKKRKEKKMLIFRLKKQLHLLPIVLFSFLGIFLITNNPVMAMEKNKPLQTFYNIETNNVRINQNKPIKISYYVKDKNLSLEDMAKNINIINKIK